MEIKDLVGRNVRQLRLANELTQEELAAKSGVSQQYISGLESGTRNPTIEMLAKLAHAMKVSHVDLVAIPEGTKIRVPKRKTK